jgi:hypothetical protein
MAEGRRQRVAKPEEATDQKQEKEERQQEKTGRAKDKAALVRKVIEAIEDKLDKNELKPTVGDFIRLLHLETELAEEQPREIKVSWVEPSEKEDAPAE